MSSYDRYILNLADTYQSHLDKDVCALCKCAYDEEYIAPLEQIEPEYLGSKIWVELGMPEGEIKICYNCEKTEKIKLKMK